MIGRTRDLLTACTVDETAALRVLPGTRKEEVFDERRDEQHERHDAEHADNTHAEHHASAALHHSIHVDLLGTPARIVALF